MTGTPDADVLIIGAGPVGLLAALDLSSRGISAIVVETRDFLEPPNVKCNHVASRTMESLRRLGIAAEVRAAGLPADYPQDVAFRTSLTGIETVPDPDPGQRRAIYGDHRARHVVGDAGTAAPDQSDLPRADPRPARGRGVPA